jgi:hypothetical protein
MEFSRFLLSYAVIIFSLLCSQYFFTAARSIFLLCYAVNISSLLRGHLSKDAMTRAVLRANHRDRTQGVGDADSSSPVLCVLQRPGECQLKLPEV